MDAPRRVGVWGEGKRWLWLSVIGAAVLFLANFSLLYGWLNTPPGTRFLGLRTVVPADTPVYYSYLRQVQEGALAVRDRYTAEPQPLGTVNVLWLVLGRLGAWFRLTPPVTFHLSRLLLGGLLLWTLWAAIHWWLADARERWTAWLVALGSGVGFLISPWIAPAQPLARGAGYHWPVDLWLPWASPVASLAQSPHLVASWLLLAAVLVLAVAATERQRFRWALLAGLGAALLVNFHPYHGPTLLAVAVTWLVLEWVARRRFPAAIFPYLLPLALGTALSLGYHQWLLNVSPVLAARAAQNFTRLPAWPLVLAGLGLAVPLALSGLRRGFRDAKGRFAVAWVVAAGLLMSWPSQFQARYLQGVLLPLAVLAAPGMAAVLRWISRRSSLAAALVGAAVLAVLLYGSPVALSLRDLQAYRRNPAAYYFPEEFFTAARALQALAKPGDAVFASHDSALILGGYANVTLYFGHGDETINSAAKRRVVEEFFSSGNAAWRAQLLAQAQATYVWEGWIEQQLDGPPLSGVPGLTPVFRNAQVTIYRFTPPDG